MVKCEQFYERSYVEEFYANCSVRQERDFLCARNWTFVSTMQHIRAIEKPQEFLVFKIQLLGKYVRQHHPKRPTKGYSVISKELNISRETKKEQGSLFREILFDRN